MTANPYIMAAPKSLALRVVGHMRRKMYQRFLSASQIQPHETLLDVGVTAAADYDSFNYVEAWYPHKGVITAVGLDDASYLEKAYPGVTFIQADGLALPFADNRFDIVHASAVLEHVGNRQRQQQLIHELLRVAKRGVFLTTPNRWFPIELHTLLPLLHWLPERFFRFFLRGTRYNFYADEAHLNLLTRSDLKAILPPDCAFRISSVSLLGWPSNLILWIHKNSSQ